MVESGQAHHRRIMRFTTLNVHLFNSSLLAAQLNATIRPVEAFLYLNKP